MNRYQLVMKIHNQRLSEIERSIRLRMDAPAPTPWYSIRPRSARHLTEIWKALVAYAGPVH